MNLLDILVVMLILSWAGGYSFNFGGDLIHLLLVIALIGIVLRVVRGQRIT